MTPIEKIAALGFELPKPAQAVANYVGYTIAGNTIIISGQLPIQSGEVMYKGKLGKDIDLKVGQDAARLCALNIIAQLNIACEGDLTRVQKCLRLGGFVNATDIFTDHPKVINGASDFMVEVFGADIGRHARAAVGVSSLPLGAAVEIEALFLID